MDTQKQAVAENLLSALERDMDVLASFNQQKQDELDQAMAPVLEAIESIETMWRLKIEIVEKRIAEAESKLKKLAMQEKESLSTENSRFGVVFYQGRKSWNTKGLEGYAVSNPEILAFQKQGNPYAVIRESKK